MILVQEIPPRRDWRNPDRIEITRTRNVHHLERKTAQRERLGPAASDRLARVQRILDLATHVLGQTDKASLWLTSESRALDGEVPLRMLDTDIGTQRVQHELRAIEFGMPL